MWAYALLMSDSELVRIERHDAVAVITMVRPPVNALNRELVDAVLQAIEHLGHGTDSRVLIITGGRRAFSSGADVNELRALPASHVREWIQHGQRVFNEIASFSRPVIAAI